MTFGVDVLRRTGAAIAFGFVVTALGAESITVDQLLQSLAQVKTARASFVEKKFLAIVDRPVESAGNLIYVAPHRLEKHTLRPRAERMILDGDELSIEDVASQRVRSLSLQEYPVLRAFVESIRATLAGDAAALNRFYSAKLVGNRAKWQLVLVPRDLETQRLIRAIYIGGSAELIRSVEVQQNDGDRSVMTLTDAR